VRRASALAWLSITATVLAETPGTRLDLLRGDASSSEFAQAVASRPFEFPRDHGPHPQFRHEWWYVTGHLSSKAGDRFGFELTFFRYALAPRPADANSIAASAWRTRQIYLAHFAVTDLERRKFHFTERYARGAIGLAGARSDPMHVWLENWHLQLSDAGGSLRAASHRYRIDLSLRPLIDPVLNGERGLSRKTANAASYYYSIPRIAIRGHIAREQDQPLEVDGLAWLDREWGSGSLGGDQQGWDWFALQFDDGAALMFYALRRQDGSRDSHSAGTWVAPDGSVRPLKNHEVELEAFDWWNSPRGGAYPAAWRLQVPAIQLELSIRPLLPDQELATSPRYWEGAVAVKGRRGALESNGQGYVELVGYARPPDRATMPRKSAPPAPYEKGRSP
jgi:predicted secreted hydrolase